MTLSSPSKLVRATWRSRVIWLLLTAIVVIDTLSWTRVDWLMQSRPAGIVPTVAGALLPAGARPCVDHWPEVDIGVGPADATGARTFFDIYTQGSRLSDAEYEVRGQRRVYQRGLWAPCIEYENAGLRVWTIDSRLPPPPAGIELTALNWYAAQPAPPEEAAERARVITRLRTGGTTSRLLRPGIVHDAIMLLLAIVWLGVTGDRLARTGLRIWSRRRGALRRSRGQCEACGYDIYGCGLSRCPECGALLDSDVGGPPARH